MLRRFRYFVVGLAVVGLSASLFATPMGAATPRQQQGVSNDEIEIAVIVPDIDALRAKGVDVSNLTTADFTKRISGYFDAYGPINGRTIVVKQVGWDPIDATSFDKACTEATQDNKPFVVINGSGYRDSSIPCISVDNKTPYITGDMVSATLQKASGKNLLSLGLPTEVAGRGAAEVVAKTKAIPKSAKIGILSNNVPQVKAAADALESALEKRGYDVVSKPELNGLAADVGVLQREATAAFATFQAEGVDTVFNTQSWTGISGFFAEMQKNGAAWKVFGMDGQGNTCLPSSATRLAPAIIGATCITSWDPRSNPTKDGMQADSALEAKCREEFDEANGLESLVGSGGGSQTVAGVTYPTDISPMECTIASVLLPAIEKAGKNLTWNKVHANMLATTKAPAAYMSDGEGGFGKNKPYFSGPVMQFTVATVANADTPQDANGLYNGCAIPAPCWIPQVVDGEEWFPITIKGSQPKS
jgi:hypothetical protein